MPRKAFAACTVLLIVVLSLPTASAQRFDAQLRFEDVPEDIVLEPGRTRNVPFTLVLERQQPAVSLETINVYLSGRSDPGIRAEVRPEVEFRMEPGQTRAEKDLSLFLAASWDAPAFEPVYVNVFARSDDRSGTMGAPADDEMIVEVTPGYRGQNTFLATNPLRLHEDEHGRFSTAMDYVIANDANGRTITEIREIRPPAGLVVASSSHAIVVDQGDRRSITMQAISEEPVQGVVELDLAHRPARAPDGSDSPVLDDAEIPVTTLDHQRGNKASTAGWIVDGALASQAQTALALLAIGAVAGGIRYRRGQD